MQYQRDVLGRVTGVTVQGAADTTVHATSYGYDAVGNLTSIEDPTGGTTEIEVDDVNRPIRRELPKPVNLTFLFAFSGSRKYQFKRMEKLIRKAKVAGVILTITNPK